MKNFFILVLSILSLTPLFTGADQNKNNSLPKERYVPDISTFMQIGGAYPAGYSWDGREIYFESRMSGAPQIYRINEKGWPYQLTMLEDGIDFFALSWSSEKAIIGASIGGSENSQLFIMDTKTGRLKKLTDKNESRFENVLWSRDDREIFYRSNIENGRDFHIYRMDPKTAIATKIFGDADKVHGSLSINDISRDNKIMIVSLYNSNVSNELYQVDLTSGEYKRITKDKGDVLYDNVLFSEDQKSLILTSDGNTDGIMRIASLDLETNELSFSADNWIAPKWNVERLVYARDYKYIAAVYNENGYNRLKIRNTKSKKELPVPPLNGMVDILSFDNKGACLLFYNDPTRTQDLWRWIPKKKKIEQLTFSSYAGIDQNIFIQPTLINYKSFDGLTIPAFLYLPPAYKKENPVPFIIDAHGGPEGQTRPYFQRNTQYFLLNGFGILAPNPRGSTGYGRNFTNLDNYKKRKDSLKDYKAAYEFLVENGYSKNGMVGIRGASYGGYVVLGMLTEYPDLFSAGIEGVGIANFVTFLENTAPYRRHLREAEYGPLSDPDFLNEISPIHKVDKIKTPLFVIHGENDPRVNVKEARQIIKAITDKGGIVESLIFPDEGHGTSKMKNILTEYKKQVSFFNKYLVNK